MVAQSAFIPLTATVGYASVALPAGEDRIRFEQLKRREFITLLSSAAAAWPLTAWAQQPQQMRRIGVLMGWNKSDPEAQSNLAAFVQELQQLGWMDGRNIRIDYRWSDGEIECRFSRKSWRL